MDKWTTGFMRSIYVTVIICLSISTSLAQTTTFTYQGRIKVNDYDFRGTGLFRFALVTSLPGILTRCLSCNDVLLETPRERVRGRRSRERPERPERGVHRRMRTPADRAADDVHDRAERFVPDVLRNVVGALRDDPLGERFRFAFLVLRFRCHPGEYSIARVDFR